MLKQIPVKKEYLFIAAVIILLLISYQLAFKKTIEAWQAGKQLQAQIAQASDLSVQPAYLERKNANLSKIIGFYKMDTIAFRNNIISSISLIAEKEHVKLSEVPLQDPIFNNDKFIIQKLSFEGGFFDLVKVLDQLEKTKGIGISRSVAFKKAKSNSGNDMDKLMLDVYFETTK